ncbi:MAG: hypothetical protein MJ252_05825 [archaeon]|nr:hypothetical protein [archaeon]
MSSGVKNSFKASPLTQKNISGSKSISFSHFTTERKPLVKSRTLPFVSSTALKTQGKILNIPLMSTNPTKEVQFLGKKRKQMTSEEIELEQIKMERAQFEKEKKENWECYEKSKKYKPVHLMPAPLTLLKPFKLSSSYSQMYLKRRESSTKYETNLVNEKIKKKLEEKCLKYNQAIEEEKEEKMKEIQRKRMLMKSKTLNQTAQISNENLNFFNTENKENLFQSKEIFGESNKSIEKFDNAVEKIKEEINKDEDFKIMSFSKRINKYNEMNNMLLMKQNLTQQMEGEVKEDLKEEKNEA